MAEREEEVLLLPHHAELVARLALGIFSEKSLRRAQ
jgi:hypothetical protein